MDDYKRIGCLQSTLHAIKVFNDSRKQSYEDKALIVGGIGKEFTMPDGSIGHHNPEYIKRISQSGKFKSLSSDQSIFPKVLSSISTGKQIMMLFDWQQDIRIRHTYSMKPAIGRNITSNGFSCPEELPKSHTMLIWMKLDVQIFLLGLTKTSMISQ